MISSEEQLPRRYGRFVLFDKIGEGGMARIYLAKSATELGAPRRVVVKQILPLLSNNQDFSRLFIDEAKLSAQLTHGNIAQVIDLGRAEEQLYIAMEYVEGFDLRELLRACSRKQVPLPIEFALLIICEVLRALDYAHRKRGEDGQRLNIVHRDVSPSNVLISFEGEVKLCDFGIARAMGTGEDVPKEAIQGKAGYMSPEAASGERLDGRADVFAAGIMLWELLMGQRLYRSPKGSGGPSLQQAREANIPALVSRGYVNEERLHEVVMKLLAKQADERYASAAVALRELEDYIASAGMLVNPLRFGQWLTEHFGEELLELRRLREQAVHAELVSEASAAPEQPSASAVLPAAFPDPPPQSAPAGSSAPDSLVNYPADIDGAPLSLQGLSRPSQPESERPLAPRPKALVFVVPLLVFVVILVVIFVLRSSN